MSSPLRRWWHFGVAGSIPLLALALGAGDGDARSIERDIGSGASQKTAAQKSTAQKSATPENAKAVPADSRSVGARNHDPCCGDEPPVPRARVGAPADSRVAPAITQPQPAVRGTSPSASPIRSVKRDGKAAPPAKQGEQRRGGVGSLIGITFA
jgi:hypothetical protein